MPLTFMRWSCLLMMLVVGPISGVAAFMFLCGWASIGIYQLKNGMF